MGQTIMSPTASQCHCKCFRCSRISGNMSNYLMILGKAINICGVCGIVMFDYHKTAQKKSITPPVSGTMANRLQAHHIIFNKCDTIQLKRHGNYHWSSPVLNLGVSFLGHKMSRSMMICKEGQSEITHPRKSYGCIKLGQKVVCAGLFNHHSIHLVL